MTGESACRGRRYDRILATDPLASRAHDPVSICMGWACAAVRTAASILINAHGVDLECGWELPMRSLGSVLPAGR